MESLVCRIVPMVAISFLFTSELMPPIDIISANAAGSLFPSKDMATEPFSRTITYCEISSQNPPNKQELKKPVTFI